MVLRAPRRNRCQLSGRAHESDVSARATLAALHNSRVARARAYIYICVRSITYLLLSCVREAFVRNPPVFTFIRIPSVFGRPAHVLAVCFVMRRRRVRMTEYGFFFFLYRTYTRSTLYLSAWLMLCLLCYIYLFINSRVNIYYYITNILTKHILMLLRKTDFPVRRSAYL